jgi:hypothetical protein
LCFNSERKDGAGGKEREKGGREIAKMIKMREKGKRGGNNFHRRGTACSTRGLSPAVVL